MNRNNFYILLDLPVNPPEDNPKIIENAIKKKQAEWSRLRNHPSKGIQAQQYLGMMPEIRKVMADEKLRKTEVQQAIALSSTIAKDKSSEIDRHLEIHLSKGFVTKKEILKLSKLHSIKESEINGLIKEKEKKKYATIDKQLNIKISKGYITESEIENLANMHAIAVDQIQKRINCPIFKKNKKIKKLKQLDESLKKIIITNLKIVNKASLYDFLSLSTTSSLKKIQKKIREKETEILKISKKNAVVTASQTLIGQCMTIFKSDELRITYNISMAMSQFNRLDADIDVAGMQGKIRSEYFDILVKTGIDLGMDHKDACEYIHEYCKNKNMHIESQAKKRTKPLLLTIFSALISVFIISYAYTYFLKTDNKTNIAYQKILEQVKKNKHLENKKAILLNYINSHEIDSSTLDAKEKIKKISIKISEKKYSILNKNIKNLTSNNNFEEAVSVYKNYLSTNPDSIYNSKIQLKIKNILIQIDNRDYEKMKKLGQADGANRIDKYINYLDKYPKSPHRNDIYKKISKMKNEYYIFIIKKIQSFKEQKKWYKCIQFCKKFIAQYENDKRSIELKALMVIFSNKIHDQKILELLTNKVKKAGDDYKSAKQILLDYLQAYPKFSRKNEIMIELDKISNLEQRHRINLLKKNIRKLLNQSKGRYVENKDGIITDTKTGLMWLMIDSEHMLGKCLTYNAAIKYVKNLTISGYDNWRMPTSPELINIYKKKPFFPCKEIKWYWTSNSYSRYSINWSTVVDTVSSKKEISLKVMQKDSRECGAIRAIRP